MKKLIVAAVSAVALTVGSAGLAHSIPPSAEDFCGPAGDQCAIQFPGIDINPLPAGEPIGVNVEGVAGAQIDLQLFSLITLRDGTFVSSNRLGDPISVTGTGTLERIQVPTSASWTGTPLVLAPVDWDGRDIADLIPAFKGQDNHSSRRIYSEQPWIKGFTKLGEYNDEFYQTATHDLAAIASGAADFETVFVDLGVTGTKLKVQVLIDGEWVDRTSEDARQFDGTPYNEIGESHAGLVSFKLPTTPTVVPTATPTDGTERPTAAPRPTRPGPPKTGN